VSLASNSAKSFAEEASASAMKGSGSVDMVSPSDVSQ